MSKTMIGLLLVIAAVAVVPFALVARSRSQPSATPPPHLVLDMDKQPKFKPQGTNPMFADDRAMRPPILYTVAREDLQLAPMTVHDAQDPHLAQGLQTPLVIKSAADFDRIMTGMEPATAASTQPAPVKEIPIPVTNDLLARGQERFNVYCLPCHGAAGYGDGPVATRAKALQDAGSPAAGSWVQPTSYHTDAARAWPPGHLFDVITHGIRNMPPYDKQIPVADRWAIAAYVKALQLSQHATQEDIQALPASAQPR
jgi:mono/diheme cytochrome c family protein